MLAALRNGKHVLSEKPITRNAVEARAVREIAAASDGTIVEGFYFLHHPVNLRLRELSTNGDLGEIRGVEIVLAIPAPPDGDPRWSLELAGGATMDLGCHLLNAARQFGRWIGGQPELVSVEVTLKEPEVDSAMTVDVAYPGGITGHCVWDMDAEGRAMTWKVIGSAGTATSLGYAVPHLDNRVIITRGDGRGEGGVIRRRTCTSSRRWPTPWRTARRS